MGTDDKVLHNMYSKCVKMSMSLIHKMVLLAMEGVLDMVWHGDKGVCACISVCTYAHVNCDSIFVPVAVTNHSQSLQEFRSFLAVRANFRQCLGGG